MKSLSAASYDSLQAAYDRVIDLEDQKEKPEKTGKANSLNGLEKTKPKECSSPPPEELHISFPDMSGFLRRKTEERLCSVNDWGDLKILDMLGESNDPFKKQPSAVFSSNFQNSNQVELTSQVMDLQKRDSHRNDFPSDRIPRSSLKEDPNSHQALVESHALPFEKPTVLTQPSNASSSSSQEFIARSSLNIANPTTEVSTSKRTAVDNRIPSPRPTHSPSNSSNDLKIQTLITDLTKLKTNSISKELMADRLANFVEILRAKIGRSPTGSIDQPKNQTLYKKAPTQPFLKRTRETSTPSYDQLSPQDKVKRQTPISNAQRERQSKNSSVSSLDNLPSIEALKIDENQKLEETIRFAKLNKIKALEIEELRENLERLEISIRRQRAELKRKEETLLDLSGRIYKRSQEMIKVANRDNEISLELSSASTAAEMISESSYLLDKLWNRIKTLCSGSGVSCSGNWPSKQDPTLEALNARIALFNAEIVKIFRKAKTKQIELQELKVEAEILEEAIKASSCLSEPSHQPASKRERTSIGSSAVRPSMLCSLVEADFKKQPVAAVSEYLITSQKPAEEKPEASRFRKSIKSVSLMASIFLTCIGEFLQADRFDSLKDDSLRRFVLDSKLRLNAFLKKVLAISKIEKVDFEVFEECLESVSDIFSQEEQKYKKFLEQLTKLRSEFKSKNN